MNALGIATTRAFTRREIVTLIRAAVSSLAATGVDAITYAATASMSKAIGMARLYLLAATFGAAAGAVTNFTINRTWVFRSRTSIAAGAWKYLAVSFLTLITLQGILFASIEWAHLGAVAAWPAAKLASWLFVSFPLQRAFVFRERPA